MKSQTLIAALALALVSSTPAFADVTREQVKADLAAAIHIGDIPAGDFGQKLYEVAPGQYPTRSVSPGLTLDQVKGELAEAIRTGNIYVGDFGQKLYEVAPGRYPTPYAQSGVSRQQVKVETVDAIRTATLTSRNVTPSL